MTSTSASDAAHRIGSRDHHVDGPYAVNALVVSKLTKCIGGAIASSRKLKIGERAISAPPFN